MKCACFQYLRQDAIDKFICRRCGRIFYKLRIRIIKK
uniref:Ferric uptake regulator Fur family n=1 Tax=Clostridium botulinum TaxID=1491 RepID=A0A0A0UV22_CLOBO|nr:ferric uptake regulator Fur family [Clostridium botulinum]AIW54748.1 ferric uptake regulator, Fur family [Clostridium botulinum]AIW54817.1 hypothetical protein [Clostridium botulinum]AIW54878.1 ferric uptake regulator Fur family [Clostridium botulinum]